MTDDTPIADRPLYLQTLEPTDKFPAGMIFPNLPEIKVLLGDNWVEKSANDLGFSSLFKVSN